jgi:hypothetical protein
MNVHYKDYLMQWRLWLSFLTEMINAATFVQPQNLAPLMPVLPSPANLIPSKICNTVGDDAILADGNEWIVDC